MKKSILGERANFAISGPGQFAYEAEVEVRLFFDNEKKSEVYFVQKVVFSEESFTVSKTSLFDTKEEVLDIVEEYDSFEDTKKSEFAREFAIVERMIQELGN